MRSMDIIELNMRQTEGKETFAMDACVGRSFLFFSDSGTGGKTVAGRTYVYI